MIVPDEPLAVRQDVLPQDVAMQANALTQRQRQVMAWIAEGKTDWEIGLILGISPKTVNFHVETAKRKLAATTRGQAIAKLAMEMRVPKDGILSEGGGALLAPARISYVPDSEAQGDR